MPIVKITVSDEFERRAAASLCEVTGIVALLEAGDALEVTGYSPHADATLRALVASTADDMRPPPSKWEVFDRVTGLSWGIFLARDGAGAREACAKHRPEADRALMYAEQI